MIDTLGIHHLGLAISDLEASTRFFTDCLGWSIVRELPDYPATFVSNGTAFITLWQTIPGGRPFDRKAHVGLHHVAIRVPDEGSLMAVFDRVTRFPGVVVEFAPEPLRDGSAKHCMIYEPSGVRVEFVWAP